MPIFPNLNSASYDDQDRTVITRMENFYMDSVALNQQYWAEADTDMRFYSGDQTVWNDIYGNSPIFNRRQFSFNRIRRVVEMAGGYQRKNRKSTIVTPIENSDDVTADQFTKIMFWLDQQEGINGTISEAFTGALITGLNLLQVWVDYREDPTSGNIKLSNCSYNSFVIDPFFKKQDLSDCTAIWKRSFVTKQQAYSLLPDQSDLIDSLYGQGQKDGKFQYMPESYDYNMKNLFTYDEYHYRDFRNQKMLLDTQTSETMEWKGKDSDLREFLQMYPSVTVIEQQIPTTRLAIVLQGKVMFDGPNTLGIDDYPFIPVLGYYTPELPYYQYRIQGMVRGLRDAQYLYNRRKIIELDILESQVNSGWVAKENAFVDPKSPYKSGQGEVLWLKEEAQMTDVQRIEPAGISQSMFQLSEQLGREVMEISGVNEELLGSATDDKAGVLSMLRQGAGLTTLQRLFDQLDMSQKLLGRIILKIIQANFTPSKVKRIIGEEPTQEFYNKNFGKYDAAVEEGFDTATQKQMQFAQLLQLRELGLPIPSDILIESATLQNKKQLIEAIQKAEQAQQQQAQQQSQMAMQQQQVTAELAKSEAAANYGLMQERMSRIEENRALAIDKIADSQEKRAMAQRDEEEALLTKIKMIKELEGIDLAHLGQLINMVHLIEREKLANPPATPEPEDLYAKLLMLQQSQGSMPNQDFGQQEFNGISNQPIAEEPPVMGQL